MKSTLFALLVAVICFGSNAYSYELTGDLKLDAEFQQAFKYMSRLCDGLTGNEPPAPPPNPQGVRIALPNEMADKERKFLTSLYSSIISSYHDQQKLIEICILPLEKWSGGSGGAVEFPMVSTRTQIAQFYEMVVLSKANSLKISSARIIPAGQCLHQKSHACIRAISK